MIDRATGSAKQMGLHVQTGTNTRCPNFKGRFLERYEMCVANGPMTGVTGHNSAATAMSSDNDSLDFIVGSMDQMQLSNNTNAQMLEGGLLAISNTQTHEFGVVILATEQ